MFLKKTLVMLVVVSLTCGLMLFSADDKQQPVVKKGAEVITIKGTLRQWSSVPKISLDAMKEARKLKPVLNFEDPRKIKKQTNVIDPVVQKEFTRNLTMPDTDIDFAGMNLNQNGAGWPPDTNGDVGPNYFIQTVNTSIGIYNKSTGALVSATTFDSFFGGTGITGTPCDNDNYGDPIVLFDQYSQRWFILDFAWYSNYSGGSWYSVAVSKTSDPTGAWWLYALNADTSLMNDYPKCGIWHDGIYVTANMFQFTGSFQHVKIWAFKKPDIYNGTLTVQTVTDSSYQAFSLLPVNAKGTTAPVSSHPCYFYAQDADEYGSPSIDAIYVWKYDVDWSTPANTTWTGHWTMNTAAYGLTATRVPQQGTSNTLDSLYGRLMFPAMYRNFGTYASVYLCHVCEYSSRRAMRWYEIRINSSGTSSIYQQGTYSPDSNHRWMGAVGGDKYGNIAMGYSVSSSTMYPSIRYTGRLSTDTLGQMPQGEASMVEGTGYQSSYTRWGDYSSMTIDPDDDETFWYTQEYYITSGTNWQTRIGSFKFATTPDPDPPVITNVSSNPSDTTATITWTTDEASDSEVQYGLTTSYGSSASSSAMVTAHSIQLTGLTPQTTYHYKVLSTDASSNTGESGDYTFTTLAQSQDPEIYVYNIAMSKSSWWILYRASATITIRDTDGNVVPNATVYTTWNGKWSGTRSGTTNSSGQVTLTTAYVWGDGTFTCTVTNVTHATLQYNASLNIETSDFI